MKTRSYALFATACALFATPCVGQDIQLAPDRYAVTVRSVDLNPATPSAARRVFRRLDAAALAVCGASEFSVRDAIEAEHRSACWRDAMARALAQVENPLLRQLYHRHTNREVLP